MWCVSIRVQVERFKLRQSWEDALHARFDCYTGDPVTSDDEWGHLQVCKKKKLVYYIIILLSKSW